MKHIRHILALIAVFVLTATAAHAIEGVSGDITTGVEYNGGDADNAKLNQYRVNNESRWGAIFDANVRGVTSDSHVILFGLDYKTPEDISVSLHSIDYGMYKMKLDYNRFGHQFATDVTTLYSGVGTGSMTIDPGQRAILGSAPSPTLLTDAIISGNVVDLFLVRDRVNADFEWDSLRPVTLYTGLDYEHREGDRPYGGSFGFTNVVEIAEPIDYDTYNVKVGGEFAGTPLYADLSYHHSTFKNNIESISYDNIRTTTGNAAYATNALYPSNTFDSVSLVAAKNLPLNSTVSLNLNYGWQRQDEQLLAPTTNPLLNTTTATYTSTSSLPRDSANAAVDTGNADLRFTSRPIDKLDITAGLHYYQHDNTTPVDGFPFIPDETSPARTATPDYTGWITRTGDVEASYEVARRTRLGANYEYESETFFNGTVPKNKLNTYKVFADSRAFDWMSARLSVAYTDGDSSYSDYVVDEALSSQPNGELPYLRKFYAASVETIKPKALLTFMPMDDLSLTFDYAYQQDKYDASEAGLLNDRTHTAGFDVAYEMAKDLSVNAYYNYENISSTQESRQWTPGATGLGNPYTDAWAAVDFNGNWQLISHDNVHTVGLGANAGIIPGRLSFAADGAYSLAQGRARFDSPVGTATNDTNFFELLPYSSVDTTSLISAGGSFKLNVTKAIDLMLSYRFEKWNILDYQYDGVAEVVTSTTGSYKNLLDMNTLYQPYTAHLVFLGATYKF